MSDLDVEVRCVHACVRACVFFCGVELLYNLLFDSAHIFFFSLFLIMLKGRPLSSLISKASPRSPVFAQSLPCGQWSEDEEGECL